MGIADDATTLLLRLAEMQRALPNTRSEYVDGPTVDELLQFGPDRLNNAVALLEENGYLDVLKTFGTAPYDFNSVRLLSRGRFEAEQIAASATEEVAERDDVLRWQLNVRNRAPQVTRFPQPVGSPFGFTTLDWEAVSADHRDAERLVVTFGHQWESSHFDTNRLRSAVRETFDSALTEVLPELKRTMQLDFRVLAAGYGGHLFNRIARDIIGSDIAVFETSDLNPNVMIELGVALTWDVRILPIRRSGAPTPPSDISGQTWALYSDDGNVWADPEHKRHLRDMVRFACRRKPRFA
jgi:hypothetical protein